MCKFLASTSIIAFVVVTHYLVPISLAQINTIDMNYADENLALFDDTTDSAVVNIPALVAADAQCTCVLSSSCYIGSEKGFLLTYRLNVRDMKAKTNVCKDMFKVCCPNNRLQSIVMTTAAPVPVPNAQRKCGTAPMNGITYRLEGVTNEASFGQYPWTLALMRVDTYKYLGGASLIHKRVALTGYHRIQNVNMNNIVVRAGEWDTKSTSERYPHQDRRVTQLIFHEQYNPNDMQNDLALLYLAEPFEMLRHINVVCLPKQNEQTDSRFCIMSGWGQTDFDKTDEFSNMMKRVEMPIVDHDSCEQRLQNALEDQSYRLDAKFLCAGGVVGVDACTGDGGAPLVCPSQLVGGKKRYIQYGIVSWGVECNGNIPGGYTRVAVFRDWIDRQMNLWGLTTTSYAL